MNEKIRSIIGAVLVVLLLLAMFISHFIIKPEPSGEPESAAVLWEKISEKMDALESMETTIITEKTYYQGGYQYHHIGTNYILSTKDAHYTHSKNVVTCPALSMEQTMELIEAYYDGKMYRSVNDGVHNQKLCSAMSHEDYDGRHTGELSEAIPLAGCTNSDMSQEENGWKLTYSGYTKKAINAAVAALGLTGDALGNAIEDMQVTFFAGNDYYVQEMDIVFVFAPVEDGNIPSFTVKTVYSEFNTAVFDPAKLNTEEYVEIEDIRLLETISAAIAERQNVSAGRFDLSIHSSHAYMGQTVPSQEMNKVTYGWKENGYFYQIENSIDGKNTFLLYENKEQTVTKGEQSYKEPMTDEEAKAFVDSLIDTARYDPLSISSVEKLEEGVYLLITDTPNLSDYSIETVENIVANQQIKVTLQDGKLMKIESALTITGVNNNESVKVTTEAVVDFTVPEEPSEA